MRINLYQQRRSLAAAVVASLVLLGAGPALAAGEAPAPAPSERARMAEARVFSSGIDLTPKVGYTKAILTISGQGAVFRRVIEASEPIEIGMFDPENEVLRDGAYRWELRLMPDEAMAKKLRAMARAGKSTRDVWPPARGEFVVRGGSIDTSGEVEPAPVRDHARSGRDTFQGAQGAAPSAPRASSRDDQAVASGAAELVGAARATASVNEASTKGLSPQTAAARLRAGETTDSAALAAAKPVAGSAAAAQPEVSRRKYRTPDNQGRPESAKKDNE